MADVAREPKNESIGEASGTAEPEGPRRELTVRAFVIAVLVAVFIGASYPYVVLKIGYGPNISVVSAFFGFMALGLFQLVSGMRATRWENNLVQTAGTAAGQAGFMCVVLAAIDMLNANPKLNFALHLDRWQIFAWMSVAGIIGVLLAVPLRKHYIDEENLPFADGTAAGETLMVLYRDPNEAKSRVRALNLGLLLSAALAFLRDGPKKLLPESLPFGEWGEKLKMGTEVSFLSIGAGLLVGLRITLSMALGSLIAWVIVPGQLVSRGIVPAATFKDVLRWGMWPATGLMVAGGLTALVLKWKVIAKTFDGLRTGGDRQDEFPLRWVVGGVSVFGVLLCLLQYFSLHFPIWLTLVSLVLSAVLMLVGTRVLGETNWAPISALANLMQAVFAGLAPGSVAINMVGSGMSGTIASNGEHLMQDFRAGKIVGSNNRHLTFLQLVGVPVGSAAVALAYPALREQYGIGEGRLSSPISVKWAGFAELLNEGFDKLPRGCFTAMLVAVVVGVLITVLEGRETQYKKYLPSPTGVALGMLIPGHAVVPMVLGGLIQALWAKKNPKHEETYNTPLASGFITGEALMVILFAILAVFGVRF
jgi:uncharacterized oligopeptide transporter (OPT) family protein